MPKKTWIWESDEYAKTLTIGPGFKFAYEAKLKSYEENIPYRKKEGLDVYDDNDQLIGFARRFVDMWQCCLLVSVTNFSGDHFRDMAEMNRLAKEKGIIIPELGSILHYGTRTYYTWTSKKHGFFIRKKINREIKEIAQKIRELNFVPMERNNNEMERI